VTRVVFVDHSGALGGGQLGLARYLEHPSELERSAVLLESGPLAARLEQAGIRTTVLAGRAGKWGALGKVRAVRRALRELAPDIVVANSTRCIYLLAAARFRGPAWLAYVREDVSAHSLSALKRALLDRVALPRFDGVIANSAFTLSGLSERIRRRMPHAVAYPVSGISAPVSAPHRAAADGPLRVLSLSRLYPWKGVHVLIAAARLLAQGGHADAFEFTIAGDAVFGDDGYAEGLRRRAAESGAAISFVGHVADVEALLAESDVLALCSITPEAFGQVVPQAMAHGLVVVAPDQGGPAEIIADGETGALVPPGDAEALAAELLRLANDAGRRAALGERARARAADFADERTVTGLEDALATTARLR
jgi:glycosyltransferase involved in cell wall biosynthesis